MNYFHWGARMLGKSSPALLLIGGAALALCSQPVRRGLHRLAVQTTKGILIVNDEVKKLAVKMKEQNVDNESAAAGGELPNEPYQLTGKHKVQNRSDKRQIVAQKIQSKFN